MKRHTAIDRRTFLKGSGLFLSLAIHGFSGFGFSSAQAPSKNGFHVYATWGNHGSILAKKSGSIPQFTTFHNPVTATYHGPVPNDERHFRSTYSSI